MQLSLRDNLDSAIAAWKRWNTTPTLKNLTIGGLAAAAILWAAKHFAEDWTNALWDRIRGGVVALPWGAVGLFFGVFFIWLFVLGGVLAAFVGIEVVRRLRQNKTAEVQSLLNALEVEQANVKALTAQVEQHVYVMRHGNINLLQLGPLSGADLEHLADVMSELLPFAREAGHFAREMMMALLHQMWVTGEGDARHWLAFELLNYHKETLRVFELFEDQVTSRSDSREALSAFCAHHWKSLEWIERMSEFVAKPLDQLEGFHQWRTHENQFNVELRRVLTTRQLRSVSRWYESQNRPRGELPE